MATRLRDALFLTTYVRKPLVFPGDDGEGDGPHEPLDRLAAVLGFWELGMRESLAATVHKLPAETILYPTTSTAEGCRRQKSFPEHNR